MEKARFFASLLFLLPWVSACGSSKPVLTVSLFSHIVLGIMEVSFFVFIVVMACGKIPFAPTNKKKVNDGKRKGF